MRSRPGPVHGAGGLALVILVVGCGEPVSTEPPASVPPPVGVDVAQAPLVLPEIAWRLPTREAPSPYRLERSPEVVAARRLLAAVVDVHGRDPEVPWAVAHALLVHGPELELSNGEPAVDYLFTTYAERVEVGGEQLVDFPAARGEVRIEPHTDLMLAALVRAGVSPERTVEVGGERVEVGRLYRHALATTWIAGDRLSVDGWDDLPWTVYGLAAWAPDGLEWTAEGGHAMDIDGLTTALVTRLGDETDFLREAMLDGTVVEKDRQGVFGYACGGAHLVQAGAWAVVRGHGTEADRAAMVAEVPVLFHRLDLELGHIDAALLENRQYAIVFLGQRLKFLGHFLETVHTMAATGLAQLDADQQAALERAALELVATVAVLNQMHVFDRLDVVRTADEQTYLDLVGDSAHALVGLDLAIGEAVVRY